MQRTTEPTGRHPLTEEELRAIMERLFAGEVYRRFAQRWGKNGLPLNFQTRESI